MMWQNTKIEFLSFSKIINHFRCVNFYVFISSENRTEKIIAIPSNCAYFYTIASDNIKAVDHKIISTCLYNFSWERKNQMESVTISEKQKMMRREREKKRESKKKMYTPTAQLVRRKNVYISAFKSVRLLCKHRAINFCNKKMSIKPFV